MYVMGIIGWSGVGKTTLIEGVVKALVKDGCDVATIKHAHRNFDIDKEGKDSFRHRAAGARQVLVSSPHRWALLSEHKNGTELTLTEALSKLAPVDVVLVEGYKGEGIEKIEVWRKTHGGKPLWPEDKKIIAVASDDIISDADTPYRLPLSDPIPVAKFIQGRIKGHTSEKLLQ